MSKNIRSKETDKKVQHKIYYVLYYECYIKRGRIMDKEKFLEELLKNLVSADSVDNSIDNMLEYLGRELGADRTYIFEKNNNDKYDNTYEWCKDGVIPQIDNLQDLPDEGLIDIWYKEFDKKNYIFIEDLEDYKNVSLNMYNLLKKQDINSLIAFPVFINENCVGFSGIDNPKKEIMNDAVGIFRLVSYIVSLKLKNRDVIKKLRQLSFFDQLTGVMNRHALENFVNKTIGKKIDIGVVSCDINDLKIKNDTKGHKAGDEYIIDTANAICKVFDKTSVYRIGGDEFVIVCINTNESAFYDKIIKMKDEFIDKNINVATGYLFKTIVNQSIDKMLSDVDTLMYEDKARYHSETKNDRRRRSKTT